MASSWTEEGANDAVPLTDTEPAMIEEVIGDVAEDDPSRFPNERHGPEGDQPVTGADIEDHLAGPDASVRQDSVADRRQELKRPSFLLGVACMAPGKDPLCPPVPR